MDISDTINLRISSVNNTIIMRRNICVFNMPLQKSRLTLKFKSLSLIYLLEHKQYKCGSKVQNYCMDVKWRCFSVGLSWYIIYDYCQYFQMKVSLCKDMNDNQN